MKKRLAAEAERRDVRPGLPIGRWRRRGRGVILGSLIPIWILGSLTIAYWLGEPYLRSHTPKHDPVAERLHAAAGSPSASLTKARSPDDTRILQTRVRDLEQQLADAVTRIDEIRSDVVSATFETEARAEMAALRGTAEASSRELEQLRAELQQIRDVTQQHDEAIAGIPAAAEAAVAAAARQSDDAALAAVADESRETRRWAVGAVALAAGANLLAIGVLVLSRRVLAVRQTTESDVETLQRSVQLRVDSQSLDLGESSRPASSVDDHEAEETAAIVAMREAAFVMNESAAVESVIDDENPTLLIVRYDADAPAVGIAEDLDVAAANRSGVRFAICISERDRANLGVRGSSERRTASRSVA